MLSLSTPWRHREIVEVEIHSFLTSTLEGEERSALRSGQFTPGRGPLCPFHRRMGEQQSWSKPCGKETRLLPPLPVTWNWVSDLTRFTSAYIEFFFRIWCNSPPVGQGLLIQGVSRAHITTHYSRYDSSGEVISPSQRPLRDNTKQLQQTEFHTPSGIRTHDLSRRVAADLRLRRARRWLEDAVNT